MEHLLYEAFETKSLKYAFDAEVLETNWQQHTDLLDPVPFTTTWKGYEHDLIPLVALDQYPAAAGFDIANLWNAKFRESHIGLAGLSNFEVCHRVTSFFQSWLYLGLLESVVGKKIRTSYMTRQHTDGQTYLYSRNLHYCLQSKIFHIRRNPEGRASTNTRIQLELRLVNRWIMRFASWGHPSFRSKVHAEYPGAIDQIEEVIPAIIRLSEAIEQTRLYALANYPTMGTLTWQYPQNAADRRKRALAGLGWCPFQIRLLEDTVNHSTMDWIVASAMAHDTTGHETCTSQICSRNDIDETTYQQAHVCTEESRCPKLLPSLGQVMDILRDDKIPIMRMETRNGTPRIAVGAASKGHTGPYVAISHVWADGLGGKANTGLNKCQVKRLSKLWTEALGSKDSVWFWLDSLCIPKGDREVYFKALDGIKDVYKCASAVLVIDKMIARCTTASSTEYLYARIYLSPWMQRMWTFEEAVLAKRLIFVLRDGFHVYRIDTLPTMRRSVCVVWQSLAAQLYRLRVGSSRINIGHVSQAFRYRLCNVPKEEFLSVAGMLGLETRGLLALEGEIRTRRFWLLLRVVPFNLPFLDCPKLSIPGFRWAPRTLMQLSQDTLDTDIGGGKSECTEHGLVGVYLTVRLTRVLKGSASQRQSVLYVFVKGSDDDACRSGGDSRALLRLYCTDTWPKPPYNLEFNTILFPNESRAIPQWESWASCVACLSVKGRMENDGGESVRTAQFVGRILIEKLHNDEIKDTSGTILLEKRSDVKVDADGHWGVQKMCIT